MTCKDYTEQYQTQYLSDYVQCISYCKLNAPQNVDIKSDLCKYLICSEHHKTFFGIQTRHGFTKQFIYQNSTANTPVKCIFTHLSLCTSTVAFQTHKATANHTTNQQTTERNSKSHFTQVSWSKHTGFNGTTTYKSMCFLLTSTILQW